MPDHDIPTTRPATSDDTSDMHGADRYVARPLTVHAYQWDGHNLDEVTRWKTRHQVDVTVTFEPHTTNLVVTTGYGVCSATAGDWLVLHADGDVWVFPDAGFTYFYEPDPQH